MSAPRHDATSRTQSVPLKQCRRDGINAGFVLCTPNRTAPGAFRDFDGLGAQFTPYVVGLHAYVHGVEFTSTMCTSRGHFGVARGVVDVTTVDAKGVVVSTEIVVSLKQLGHVVFMASRNAARNEGHIKY